MGAFILSIAGMITFFNVGAYEARDGRSANHRMLWAFVSLLISALVLFVAKLGMLTWVLAQAGLFVGIALVRVWLEDRGNK